MPKQFCYDITQTHIGSVSQKHSHSEELWNLTGVNEQPFKLSDDDAAEIDAALYLSG